MYRILFTGLLLFIASSLSAQNKVADSIAVTNTLKALLQECGNVDFGEPQTTQQGTFHKAAKYIVYRGDDKKRAWKDFSDYSNPGEKKGVDEICLRINRSINQDSSYLINKYFTEKESEGTWHILEVTYVRKGKKQNSSFAFLKISGRFGLGDID